MKKRIVAFILLLSMLLAIASSLGLNATAASTLTITSPSNDDHVSKSDPPKLKWSKVTGAAGYRVTVVNVDSGKDLVRNTWTTSTSYSPRRRSRIISIRSMVFTSECKYRTRTPTPCR